MQISLKTSLKTEVRRKDDNKVICSGQQLNSGYRRDWRSGYKFIDDLIRDIRLEYPYPSYQLEWIPFSEFVGLKFISRGGFSAIYESMWTNTNQAVALKCLDGSKDFSSEFLIKIKKNWSLYLQPQFSRCYGITQLPNSREFMMVMQYAPFGNLSSHLKRNYIYTWKEKIKIVKQIANGISEIHKRNLIHGDLHSGNILNIDQSHFVITDVGLCGPAGNTFVSKNAIHGVLPYVAPEILKGLPLTNKSDIYSFGIIMWEICTGSKPFSEVAHDLKLAKDICNRGKRPQIPTDTPSFYFELMKDCWDPDPDKRPDAHYISNSIDFWLTNDSLNDHLKNGGSMISSTNINNDKNIHPKAIYYSRLLDFPDLLNGKKFN